MRNFTSLKTLLVLAFTVYTWSLNAQSVAGTLRDSLSGDKNHNGAVNAGDSVSYRARLKNGSGVSATEVQYNNPTPANTSLLSGTSTSALARNDSYSFNTLTNTGNVLTNDFGIKNGVSNLKVVSFGTTASNGSATAAGSAGTTSAGGTLTVNSDGSFSYYPASAFTGTDQFTYVATTEAAGLPNNSAVVTITVTSDLTFTTSTVNLVCSGGTNASITVNATGGNGGYTYSKDNGANFQVSNVFTALSAGSYNIVVKDARNYTKSATVTLTQPPAIAVSGTIPNLTYNTAMSPAAFTKTNGVGSPADPWSATGLPPGVTMNTTTGLVSGTPMVTGTFNAAVRYTDATGCTGSLNVTCSVAPKPANDAYTVVANTQLVANGYSTPATPTTTSVNNIVTNDAPSGLTVAAVSNTVTANGGRISIDATGKFIYTPKNGSVAADSYTYTAISNGVSSTATINFTFPVTTMIWYVDNSYGGGGNNGSSNTPYTNVASAETASAAGNIIYVHTGSGNTAGDATLKASQTLRGAGSGLTVGALSIAAGTKPTLSGTVTLANSVTVDGFDMSAGTNTAITSSGATSVNVSVGNIISNGAVNAVSLSTTTGSVTIAGGMQTNSTGATINISGGTVSLTYDGAITQNANAPVVNVAGGHTGTLTFQTGTLSATNGTGLQFNNADGSYNFNGTTVLNGGDAGIDILDGSGGTFAFGPGTSITSPSGTAFNIAGTANTAAVAYSGNITNNNGGSLVNITNHNTGTLTFQTGTLSATNGTGLQFNNADGNYNFNGTTVLNGGDAGIDLLNGSGGTFVFSAGTSINSPSGTAFNIGSSIGAVTYSGNITKNNSGSLVNITNHNTKTVTFQTGVLSATAGNGLQFNNADGTYNFNGITNLNGGSAAVNIINASAGSFVFREGITITSPADTAFNVRGGTVGITYNGNITQTKNFPMVCVSQGHSTGTITFQTGTLKATNGSGLQFDDADGSYNFNGKDTLNGGDAGIDIVNGSAGSFNFATTIGSTGFISNPANEVLKVRASTANVTYSGGFTKTGATDGISIDGETGGVITINGTGPKLLNTTTDTAINLKNNTGASINFSGNNLSLTTSSGIAFNATGGGTVLLNGTGNIVTSGTGIGINVAGGTTIGAGGITFQSISANGGTNGIVLNGTGSGSFSVTGTGTTAGSGGTIQNTSNRGASFVNTGTVSLKNMIFQSAGNTNLVDPASGGGGISPGEDANYNLNANAAIHLVNITGVTLDNLSIKGGAQQGINGNNVTNFSLSNSTIQGNGNQVREDGIHFKDMLGTSTISNCTIGGNTATTNNAAVQVHVENYTGAAGTKISFSNLTIQSRGSAGISHGLQIAAHNSANVKFVVQNCSLDNLFFNSIDCATDASGLTEIIITGCTFNNVGASGINITENGTGGTRYYVHHNGTLGSPTFLKGTNTFASAAINIAQSPSGTGLMQGAVSNNYIGIPGNGTSASNGGYGIKLYTISSGTSTTLISGNTIDGCLGGIDASMSGAIAGHTLNATISNNFCNVMNVSGANAIYLNAGTLSGDLGTYNADINNNSCNAVPGFDFNIRQRFRTTFQLLGYSGTNNNNAAVQTYLDVNKANNANGLNGWSIANNVPNGGPGFVNSFGVPQPTLPTP